MTTQQKIESLVEQASELPEDAQVELLHALVEMRLQQRGIYHLDNDEREPLTRSADDPSHDTIDQTICRRILTGGIT